MKYDIYRCAPAETREAVEFLRDLGIRAWVPLQIIRRRLPRSKKRVTSTRAAIPGYVFIPQYDAGLYPRSKMTRLELKPLWTSAGAQACCEGDELIRMQEAINNEGIIRQVGQIIAPAAMLEPVAGPVDHTWMVGQLMTITVGPFKGFGGVVLALDDDGTATVDFKKSLGDLKIPACLLAQLAPMDRGGHGGPPPDQGSQDGADARPPFPPPPGQP